MAFSTLKMNELYFRTNNAKQPKCSLTSGIFIYFYVVKVGRMFLILFNLSKETDHFGISIKRRIETCWWSTRHLLPHRDHFGISIKRRIETKYTIVGQRKQEIPLWDFHQKKDWNSGILGGGMVALIVPLWDFHQKKDWNDTLLQYYLHIPNTTLGFPSKEGLKLSKTLVSEAGGKIPLWDFHQKKDWNTVPGMKQWKWSADHFGISIKRRIET